MKPVAFWMMVAMLSVIGMAGCDDGDGQSDAEICDDACAHMTQVCPESYGGDDCPASCADMIADMDDTSKEAQQACILAADDCDELTACLDIASGSADPDCTTACQKLTEVCPQGFGTMSECLTVCNDNIGNLDDQQRSDTLACFEGAGDCDSANLCIPEGFAPDGDSSADDDILLDGDDDGVCTEVCDFLNDICADQFGDFGACVGTCEAMQAQLSEQDFHALGACIHDATDCESANTCFSGD